MSETTYTYSISNDTLNSKVDGGKLKSDISSSSITIAVERIDTLGDDLDIVMKNSISTSEETTLDGIVSSHDGGPLKSTQADLVAIKEEETPTGGHFGTLSVKNSIPATSGPASYDMSFPHPIGVLAAEYVSGSAHNGDEIKFQVSPETTVGVLSAQMDSASFTASFTVPSVVFVGMYIKVGSEELGRIKAIASNRTSVTTEIAASSNIAASSVIKITVAMSPIIHLETCDAPRQVGMSKIGASYISANTVIRLVYDNKDAQAKTFIYRLEYLY